MKIEKIQELIVKTKLICRGAEGKLTAANDQAKLSKSAISKSKTAIKTARINLKHARKLHRKALKEQKEAQISCKKNRGTLQKLEVKLAKKAGKQRIEPSKKVKAAKRASGPKPGPAIPPKASATVRA